MLRNYWSDLYICLNWYITSAPSHTLISTKYHGHRNTLQECNVSKKRDRTLTLLVSTFENILIKFDHLARIGVKIKNIWNHQPELYGQGSLYKFNTSYLDNRWSKILLQRWKINTFTRFVPFYSPKQGHVEEVFKCSIYIPPSTMKYAKNLWV